MRRPFFSQSPLRFGSRPSRRPPTSRTDPAGSSRAATTGSGSAFFRSKSAKAIAPVAVTDSADTASGLDEVTGEVRLAKDMRARSEAHASELQSLMRISYAVFCLKKKRQSMNTSPTDDIHIPFH